MLGNRRRRREHERAMRQDAADDLAQMVALREECDELVQRQVEQSAVIAKHKAALEQMAWLVQFYQGLATCCARMIPEVRMAELKRQMDILRVMPR